MISQLSVLNQKPKAPSITSLRVAQLGAHFLHLKWDDIGSNFYYVVDYSLVTDTGTYAWMNRSATIHENEWFESQVLLPSNKYKFRIAVIAPGFEQSEWVETETIETFPTNAYDTYMMNQFIPNRAFVNNKLTNNRRQYIDFNNDVIYATLMNEHFVYDAGVANISNVENYIAYDREFHKIGGEVEKVCVDVNRTYLGYNRNVLYTFERYQNMTKASNDGGQTWWYYQAMNDRVGYPIARTVMSQNKNTTFILGYDELFYGRDSDEVRFSSNTHWWSDDNLTFVRLDVDSEIPFPVMVFGRYTQYPDNIRRKVEAQTCSEKWVYAVANDNFRRILTKNAPIGQDAEGNTVKMWDQNTYNITGNPNTVVKRLEVLNGVCYALVTGEVADIADDKREDGNVLDSAYKGVYKFVEHYDNELYQLGNLSVSDADNDYTTGIDWVRMNATFLPGGSHVGKVANDWVGMIFKGKSGTLMTVTGIISTRNHDSFTFTADLYDVDGNIDPVKKQQFINDFQYPAQFTLYMKDNDLVEADVPAGGDWVRIFGNTKEERDQINHVYSNMSTDGDRLFVSSPEYIYQNTVDDPDTVAAYDEVDVAVKYSSEYPYASNKRPWFYVWTTDGKTDVMVRKPHTYYMEAEMNYMASNRERCMIDHANRAVMVFPSKVHTYKLDPNRVGLNAEIWDKGTVTFKLEDISFSDFSQYCNGIMIHKPFYREQNTGGEIFGYYEFSHRFRDNVSVIWRPEGVAMTATLIEQTVDVPYTPEVQTGLVDPNLAPLIYKMGPESYFDDTNYTTFAEYYLKFISEGTTSSYNVLLNLIRNKFPLEKDSYEFLWSEIRRRNLYIDEARRDEIVRFFEAKATNFYSSKGTVDSYKFLFKLLYNADVEVEVESEVGLDYDIVIQSSNISQDLVGRTIYTATGRANVTYIERLYTDGLLRWKVTLHNLIGKLEVGQKMASETSAFNGIVTRGVAGKELAYSDIDYINRPRSYYVMKIRSELNTARYRDDIIRFVHPAGFGFIGITVLTVFINGGFSMDHVETAIETHKAFRWDAGLPSKTLRLTTEIDPDSDMYNPEPLFHAVTGALVETAQAQTDFSVSDWENAINTSTGQMFELRSYDSDEQDVEWNGVIYKPSERRLEWSPLFSHFTSRIADLRNLTWLRMKDDIGHPRDPGQKNPSEPPSQYKIGK